MLSYLLRLLGQHANELGHYCLASRPISEPQSSLGRHLENSQNVERPVFKITPVGHVIDMIP